MANYTTTRPDWAVSNSAGVMSGIEGIKDTTVGNINPNWATIKPKRRAALTEDEIVDGVINGDRVILSRAITLIESNNPKHFAKAQRVLQRRNGFYKDFCREQVKHYESE